MLIKLTPHILIVHGYYVSKHHRDGKSFSGTSSPEKEKERDSNGKKKKTGKCLACYDCGIGKNRIEGISDRENICITFMKECRMKYQTTK